MSTAKVEKNRDEIELKISRAITRFEKECTGRGPLETRTYLIEGMIALRLRAVLTPAERQMITSTLVPPAARVTAANLI